MFELLFSWASFSSFSELLFSVFPFVSSFISSISFSPSSLEFCCSSISSFSSSMFSITSHSIGHSSISFSISSFILSSLLRFSSIYFSELFMLNSQISSSFQSFVCFIISSKSSVVVISSFNLSISSCVL